MIHGLTVQSFRLTETDVDDSQTVHRTIQVRFVTLESGSAFDGKSRTQLVNRACLPSEQCAEDTRNEFAVRFHHCLREQFVRNEPRVGLREQSGMLHLEHVVAFIPVGNASGLPKILVVRVEKKTVIECHLRPRPFFPSLFLAFGLNLPGLKPRSGKAQLRMFSLAKARPGSSHLTSPLAIWLLASTV